jgi:hypothetical protein
MWNGTVRERGMRLFTSVEWDCSRAWNGTVHERGMGLFASVEWDCSRAWNGTVRERTAHKVLIIKESFRSLIRVLFHKTAGIV